MKTFKRIIPLILVLVLILSYSTTAMAYNQVVRGMNIPGSGTNRVLYYQPRENSKLTMTIYSDTNFNGNASMTFRLYVVNGSTTTDRRSNAISFYPSDASGTIKSKPFINGGEIYSYLDLRASTSGTSNGTFYGQIKF